MTDKALSINNINPIGGGTRITSIDALRAVTLLGILLVHTIALFGFGGGYCEQTSIGNLSCSAISFFLSNRCNKVFNILFGVSFYLILNNPQNSSGRFVWRCFLLMMIGLFNKIFYTFDALMWYGLWGMVLVSFRKLSTKQLFVAFLLLYTINTLVYYLVPLEEMIFGDYVNARYYTESLGAVVSYPVFRAVKDYLFAVIAGPVGTLANMVLGYCIAKGGIIDKIENYTNFKYIGAFFLAYLILGFISYYFHFRPLLRVSYMFGSFFYATLFLWLYYRFYPNLRFLEPYGKLGLTNYSCQSIFGVILATCLYMPFDMPIEFVLLCTLAFFVLQLIFSTIWLRHFKYGPFEWLWRCGTNMKLIDNRIR